MTDADVAIRHKRMGLSVTADVLGGTAGVAIVAGFIIGGAAEAAGMNSWLMGAYFGFIPAAVCLVMFFPFAIAAGTNEITVAGQPYQPLKTQPPLDSRTRQSRNERRRSPWGGFALAPVRQGLSAAYSVGF